MDATARIFETQFSTAFSSIIKFFKKQKNVFFFKNRARANELAIINIVDNLVVDNFEVD